MVPGINRFSPVFHPAIEMLAAKRVGRLNRLAGKGVIIDNQVDNTRLAKGEELQPDAVKWFGAMVTPCLFFAVAGYKEDGRIEAVSAGHFSTNFADSDIRDQLAAVATPAERTKVYMMGLGEKTSHQSLEKTTEKLCGVVNDFGIPTALSWLAEDRPIITDSRNGQIISELGFGLHVPETDSAKGRGAYGRRFVFLGATNTETICLSALMPSTGANFDYGYVFDGQQPGLEFFCLDPACLENSSIL